MNKLNSVVDGDSLVMQLRARAKHGHDDLFIKAADRIEQLEEWLLNDCFCPCCEEEKECLLDCTFVEDDPNDAERMAAARTVMFCA